MTKMKIINGLFQSPGPQDVNVKRCRLIQLRIDANQCKFLRVSHQHVTILISIKSSNHHILGRSRQ